jgi:hypothetical protein
MPAIDLTPPLICDKITPPVFPTLPSGVSFDAALPNPSFPFSARLCCKVLQFDVGSLIPPISLGISVPIPYVIALNTLIGQMNAYMAAIPMICPRE